MNFLQRIPFFRLFLALASGVLFYQFIPFSITFLIFLSVLALVLVGSIFLFKSSKIIHKFHWIFGLGVFLLLAVTSYLSCRIFETKTQFSDIGEKSVFQVELISAPIEKENSYQCKVKLQQKFDTLFSVNSYGNAMIYFQKDSTVKSLRIGDKVVIFAEFKSPDGIQNPDGFDYSKYLKRQGILATAYIATNKWKKSDEKPTFSLRRLSDEIRNKLLEIYRSFGIDGDEFAVLAALTLGYTDELDSTVIKSYSATGAMHILSVSGLHIGIVFAVFAFLLKPLDKKRQTKVLKAIIIILFLWIYAFITGLSPAVMRAALMFSFMSLANCLERKSQIYNTIFMSAFLMLLLNPNVLFNIGFQLSYAAVLSIVFFQPQISKWFYVKNKLGKWTWNLVAVSIAAQIGTVPFTLYYFHQFPNFFLLTNVVAIPLSTLVIYLAIALLFIFKIPFLSQAVAFLLKWSIWLMNFLIVWIQDLPFSISNISLDYRQIVFAFIALFFIVGYFYNKKFSVLFVGLCSLLLVTSLFFYQEYRNQNTDKIIVFSDSRVPIINFIHQGENFVFTTDSVHAEKIAGNFWKSNLLQKPIYIKENQWFSSGFALFKEKKFLILTDNSLKNKISEKPIYVDYLIISNKIKPKIESILSCITPKILVVDKSISAWYTNHIKEICKKNNIQFYSIAENGAFVLNFNP